ncbi:hypothetical protein PAPYR_11341 [Paratrimastix pyriformis]|uniref:Uncharacterized protein n=1 Tax=Paratrimastix pyriformis TaxID=342808 RepID=A0ABQ8U3Y5_9EUKA|nr:hypothetical protein PAPYR_11341 [Paratrimastix pyriformis]
MTGGLSPLVRISRESAIFSRKKDNSSPYERSPSEDPKKRSVNTIQLEASAHLEIWSTTIIFEVRIYEDRPSHNHSANPHPTSPRHGVAEEVAPTAVE